MSNAIIIGDLHLGKNAAIGKNPIGAGMNSRLDDQFKLLDWTLERSIEHNCENIIITGDVFEDPKPSTIIITFFIGWLKKCNINNVNVHIIMGNHDILRSGLIHSSPLDLINEIELENVSVYKQNSTIIIDKTAYTFVPFCDRKSLHCQSNIDAIKILKESLVYELSMIPITYKKVLIGHLAIQGSIPVGDEIDDLCNELLCPLDMFKGYDYVWMGHVHSPQVMSKFPYIAHIGSMDISNFGEVGQKKQIIILNEFGFNNEILPTRALKKISVMVPKDTKDTTLYVLEELKKINVDSAIIKLEVSLTDSELNSVNKSKLMEYFASCNAFNVMGISESKKNVVLKKESKMDSKMDVISAIKTYADIYVDKKDKADFIDLAIEIFKNI